MPAHPPRGTCRPDGGQVITGCGGKHYSLPAEDVALLPVANTTTEALAAHLLSKVLPCVAFGVSVSAAA